MSIFHKGHILKECYAFIDIYRFKQIKIKISIQICDPLKFLEDISTQFK